MSTTTLQRAAWAEIREGAAVEPGRLGRPSISVLRWCASSSRRERPRTFSAIAFSKTWTAEVTIGIIPERTARWLPTVTELGSVLNGTYAELLPLRSIAHLGVGQSVQEGLDVSSPMKGDGSFVVHSKHHPSEDCTTSYNLKRVASGSEAKWRQKAGAKLKTSHVYSF